MNTCIIKLIGNKWHCIGPDGKDWCAYDNKDWAIECGKAHGWEITLK